VRIALLALVLAAGIAAARAVDSPARASCHPTITTPLFRANLDRDRAREEVTATNVSCAHEYAYGVADQCAYHRQHHWLSGSGIQTERRIVQANGIADGREFFYVLRRSPARAPDLGTAAVVHLVRLSARRCPAPRHVFLYRAAEPLMPPPSGFELKDFDVALVELSFRYRGLEVRLTETFDREGAERRRVTLLRYSIRADRYVVYSPKL
jgi:hypothetical protein